MLYVFDTNSFTVLRHYFPDHFPSVWEKIGLLVFQEQFISVLEVFRELEAGGNRHPFIFEWIKENRRIFFEPTTDEMIFISEIFKIKKFQELVNQKQRLKSSPVADPFVIACARVRGGYVVTEEVFKENSGKIPNVFEHFQIDYTNVQGFMNREGWKF